MLVVEYRIVISTAATTFFAASVRPSAVMMFDAAFGEDLAAFFDFGAFQPHDQRHVEADLLVGFDDGAWRSSCSA